MITGNTPRPVQQLMTRCTLTVTCFLLSGCSVLCESYIEKQRVKDDSQRAAFVLLTRGGGSANPSVHRIVKDASGVESVEMDFDWNKIAIAGIPLRIFAEAKKAQQFQLNVFEYDSGKGIPSASMTDFEPIDVDNVSSADVSLKEPRKLTGLPLDTLLTVTLALKGSKASDAEEKDEDPASFVVLFKKAKDVPRPVTTTQGGKSSHE